MDNFILLAAVVYTLYLANLYIYIYIDGREAKLLSPSFNYVKLKKDMQSEEMIGIYFNSNINLLRRA